MAGLNYRDGRLHIEGDLRYGTVAALSRQLLAQAAREGDMVLDLAGVGQCDSAAVAMLAACRSVKQRQQDSLLIENVPQGLANLIGVYGLGALLLNAQ